MENIVVENLTYIYEGTDKDVINGLTTSFSSGWTGIVGPNGCGKSTLMALIAGRITPTSGSIAGVKGTVYHCKQETTTAPDELQEFIESYDKDVMRLKGSLELFEIEHTNWNDLSHGERKRMQLGVALCKRPQVLMLDEPTNHLDALNRDFIIQTLRHYRGIGILVSHDRELLDILCTRCVIYQGGKAHTLSGNYSEASKNIAQEIESKQKSAQALKDSAAAMKREVQRLAEIDMKSKKRLSKQGLNPKDIDKKKKIELARLSGKDASHAQKKVNIERRIGKTEDEIQSLRTAKSYADSVFFADRKTHVKTLLHEKPNTIKLPGVTLTTGELSIKSGDKIGITGLNGVGKSSLINWLLSEKKIKNGETFFLPQELTDEDKRRLKTSLKECEKEDYSKCLQIIARLGSDAKQVIGSDKLSAGETRKVAIALAIVNQIDLIILDEPTNHLDLHSVKHLEQALAQSNLAVLIVSHDRHFIDAVCKTRWQINREGDRSTLEVIL